MSHLITHADELEEALKRGEEIELISDGQTIGVVKASSGRSDGTRRAEALHAFFQLGESYSLRPELKRLKQGRRGRNDAV